MSGSMPSVRKDAQRILEITRTTTDALLKAIFNHSPAAVDVEVIREIATEITTVTLSPKTRPDMGATVPLHSSIDLIRTAIGICHSWEELSRVEEYDDRWHHAVRVSSDIKIDPAEPSQASREVKLRLLFIVILGMPKLHSCAATYEETAGTSASPISLICRRVSVDA
jgi:hypothetical protein